MASLCLTYSPGRAKPLPPSKVALSAMALSQQLRLTLQLLPAPSKALVASALGGVAADIVLSSSNPAHCLVYRVAYDDEAFQVCGGKQRKQQRVGRGKGGAAPSWLPAEPLDPAGSLLHTQSLLRVLT